MAVDSSNSDGGDFAGGKSQLPVAVSRRPRRTYDDRAPASSRYSSEYHETRVMKRVRPSAPFIAQLAGQHETREQMSARKKDIREHATESYINTRRLVLTIASTFRTTI